MICSANRSFRTSHFAACLSQTFERLGRCDFVNEMKIDIEKSWFVLRFSDDVGTPEFFEKGHNKDLLTA